MEADDLIGTLAARGAAAGAAVAIVSPDRDFFQLLGPGVQLLRPPGPNRKKEGAGAPTTALTVAGLVPYTAADWAAASGGLAPAQAVDVKALQGDPSDNVPGVPGVGASLGLVLAAGLVERKLAVRRVDDPRRPVFAAHLAEGVAGVQPEGVVAARVSYRRRLGGVRPPRVGLLHARLWVGLLQRAGFGSSEVPATITTTSSARRLTAVPAGGAAAVRKAAIAFEMAFAPRDPLLDAMAFSRGRFMLEMGGSQTLILPAWSEVGRVIEDCR